MKNFFAKHSLSLLLLVVLSGSIVAPVISDNNDNKTKTEVEYSKQSAGAKNFTQAMDTLYQKMNDAFYMIEPILKNSCFDCHSDQTDYPWYHSLPLIGSMIDEDIAEAREHLDFSDGFPLKGKGSQLKLFAEIIEEVEEGEMPLMSYRVMHWGTAIQDPQLDTLKNWFRAFSGLMKTMYGFYSEPFPEDIY